jgi:hypothetical protein
MAKNTPGQCMLEFQILYENGRQVPSFFTAKNRLLNPSMPDVRGIIRNHQKFRREFKKK